MPPIRATMRQRLAVAVDRRRHVAVLVQRDGKRRPGLAAVRRQRDGSPIGGDRLAMTAEPLEMVALRHRKLGIVGKAGPTLAQHLTRLVEGARAGIVARPE